MQPTQNDGRHLFSRVANDKYEGASFSPPLPPKEARCTKNTSSDLENSERNGHVYSVVRDYSVLGDFNAGLL